LSDLRVLVDALDHELLQVIARRMAVVSEMAAYKRAHGLALRDVGREEELLRDRSAYAEQLGLQPDDMDAVFRLLLQASRNHMTERR
jgi:chorismate mutase